MSSVMIENWLTSGGTRTTSASCQSPVSSDRIKRKEDGRKGWERTVLSGEDGLAENHLCQNAPNRPNVDRVVILLPREHNLRRPVVPRRDVTCHLGILDPRESKVADLEVAVFVDEDVGWLEVAVDHAGRVDILEPSEHLVDEVLNELVVERAGGEESVEVGSEELSDKVDVFERRDEDVAQRDDLTSGRQTGQHIRQKTRRTEAASAKMKSKTHVLVADVLQQLELSVGPLAQYRCRKRLHDLLDGDRGVCELVLCGAVLV